VGKTVDGCTIYAKINEAGGTTYISDEFGAILVDDTIASPEAVAIILADMLRRQRQEQINRATAMRYGSSTG
jgi:hypothetical protein